MNRDELYKALDELPPRVENYVPSHFPEEIQTPLREARRLCIDRKPARWSPADKDAAFACYHSLTSIVEDVARREPTEDPPQSDLSLHPVYLAVYFYMGNGSLSQLITSLQEIGVQGDSIEILQYVSYWGRQFLLIFKSSLVPE